MDGYKLFFLIRSSDLVDYSETTDRSTARAIVAARRIDFAIVAEAQKARVVTVRRGRPTAAADTDIVETAIVATAARTRSRIPDRGSTTELAGEVHAFIGTAV